MRILMLLWYAAMLFMHIYAYIYAYLWLCMAF